MTKFQEWARSNFVKGFEEWLDSSFFSATGFGMADPDNICPVFIYALCDPRDGGIRYVGKALSLKKRLHGHVTDTSKTHKTNWIGVLAGLGMSPVIEAVEITDEGGWAACERFWISYFRFLGFDLTNIESGGMGAHRVSDSTRKKLSALKKGVPRPAGMGAKISAALRGKPAHPNSIAALNSSRPLRRGKRLSAKHCAALSAARRLVKRGPHRGETKMKMRVAATGRKHTDESRAKMSAAKRSAKRKPHSEETRRRQSVAARSREAAKALNKKAVA